MKSKYLIHKNLIDYKTEDSRKVGIDVRIERYYNRSYYYLQSFIG